MRPGRSTLYLAAISLCCGAPMAAFAGVVATSGTITLVTVVGNEDFSEGGVFEPAPGAETVHLFEEGQAIAVVALQLDLQPSDMQADWSPGQATSPIQITGDISSHYLHFDTDDAVAIIMSGFVEFDAPILGVIVTTSSLDASDATVGSGGLTFEPGRQLGVVDSIRVEADDRRLVFSFENLAGVDQVRVVTESVAVGGPVTPIVVTGGESFVEGGAFEGDGSGVNTVYFFAERRGVEVDGLEVDLDAAALEAGWGVPDSTQPTTIHQQIDSYYLFFDSVDDSQITLIAGTVIFETPVIGVIFSDARLLSSDAALAVPGVTFAGTRNLGTPGDSLLLDASRRVLSFEFSNLEATDDIRILTVAAKALPALPGWALLALGLVLVAAGMTEVSAHGRIEGIRRR